MTDNPPERERGLVIKRERFYFDRGLSTDHQREDQSIPPLNNTTVLVINSSHLMAKEITLQLTLGLPGCSIMYAPTIELAHHILNRKQVDLVVSSPVLPDGGVEKLRAKLLELTTPPDLVVVQGLEQIDPNRLKASTQFQVVALSEFDRSREERRALPSSAPSKKENNPISTLGADIRNDLNNPLQEIVAMVYVARADREVAEGTLQALQAIDLAAKNMADYVNSLEAKIRQVIA